MRISGLLAAAALVLTGLTTVAPAEAGDGSGTWASARDISTGSTARLDVRGGLSNVEISRSSANSPTMAPFVAYDTSAGYVAPTIAPGQVVCLRMPDGTGGPVITICTARGRSYRDYAISGRRRSFGGRSTSVSLIDQATIAVPGLRKGMRVGITSGAASGPRRWRYQGERYFRNPAGNLSRFSDGDYEATEQIFPVTSAGTGTIEAGRGATVPISEVVIFPEWFVFADESLPNDYPPLPYASSFNQHTFYWPDAWVSYGTGQRPDPPGTTTELQMREGSALAKAPPWRPFSMPWGANRALLRLRAGHALCIRKRFVPATGVPTEWETHCTVRHFDDREAVRSGRTSRVKAPYFADGHATRIHGGARLVFKHRVLKGSTIGYTYQPSQEFPLSLDVNGCGPRSEIIYGLPGPQPDLEITSATKRCRPSLTTTDSGTWTVFSFLVAPPWTMTHANQLQL